MSELVLRGITKSFGQNEVLANLNLEIEAGEFICFLGPSGCGKTTLLRCLAGLETPDSGYIRIGGDRMFDADHRLAVPAHKRNIGMMFQHYALWPHMTILENLMYPLKRRKVAREQALAQVERLSDVLGISSLLDRIPAQLSGGQQQRVALGRALITHPKLILLDEPLSNLDASLRIKVRSEIRELKSRLGESTTMVMVTHDQEEAVALADRIVLFQGGKIEQIGTPIELMMSPKTVFAAQFVGYENIVDVNLIGLGDSGIEVSVPGNSGTVLISKKNAVGSLGSGGQLAFRADDIAIEVPAESKRNALRGSIVKRTVLGRFVEYGVSVGEQTVIARRAVRSGDELYDVGYPIDVCFGEEVRLLT